MTNEEALRMAYSRRKNSAGEERDFLNTIIQVLEQQPCEDKQDCEHCIHTYGTLGCCDMVNNEWIYDCDFGREQYRKEHGKPCEDCISREMALKESHKICIDGDVFDVVQVETLFALPSVTPKARWIPVSERLPDIDEEVLVDDGLDIFVAWWVDDGFEARWHSVDESYNPDRPILAWMPLPQPYKESEE